jgi:protein arginine kinase
MTMWYEETDQMHDVIVMNRLRLVRNVEGEIFPRRMKREDRLALLKDLKEAFLPEDTSSQWEEDYRYIRLDELSDNERNALYERRLINHARLEDKEPCGLILSQDEGFGIVLNGEDHLRMQLVSGTQSLENLWKKLNQIDDKLGEQLTYAFDQKYGYLTAYLTNVGTGLRASTILHLPMLSSGKQFRKLVEEYGRIGISIKGLAGDTNENFGGLYEIKNQKTLGQTEEELIGLVSQAARELTAQERKIKSLALRNHRLQVEDEVYKSYGILKYARKLSYKEGMIYLSQLRLGLCENLLTAREPVNVFGIMLHIRPANLSLGSAEPLEGDAMDEARARYVREHLPEIQ